jgi:peptidoglycan hydrolase-like protein with peptidoglycan-binding domain
MTIHAEWSYYLISAYYSPLPGQNFYLHGSYEDEVAMNGEGKTTASGQAVRIGVVAAPKEHPFGTRVRINQALTIKWTSVVFDFSGTVLDRGGAIHSANNLPRLDIYMGAGQAGLCRAINFGVQTVYVEFDTATNPVDTVSLDTIPSDCTDPHNETVPLASGATTKPFDPFTMPIGTGSPTANIKIVQNLLARIKAYTGAIDGIYDDKLIEAIFQFQKINGIVQNRSDDGAGMYGPKTRAMLKALLSGVLNTNTNIASNTSSTTTATTPTVPTTALSPDDTRELQKKLHELGFFKFDPDGIYNKRLIDALYSFQVAKNIVQSNDEPGAGYYGTVTQAALEEAYKNYESRKSQMVAIEAKIDAIKLSRDEVRWAKKEDYKRLLQNIPRLKLNQVHPEIRTLQKILKQVGYFDRKDTAIFGSVTKNALAKYQLDLKVIDNLGSQYAGILWDVTRTAIAEDLYNRWLKTDTTWEDDIADLTAELEALKKV